MTERREYVTPPRVAAELPADGKVTGPIVVTFTRGNHASARTDGAHINDNNPAVTYRGQDYLVHVGAYRADDGTWSTTPPPGHDNTPWVSVHRRPQWDDAPRSYRDAIAAAVVALVSSVATPDVLAAAEYADAYNAESTYMEEVAKAEAALRAERKILAAASRRRRKAQTAVADVEATTDRT